MNADLALIREAVLEAGKVAVETRKSGLTVVTKPGGSPVTNGDLAADAVLASRLRAARPDYGWLSEETADDASRLVARRTFMIDPVDGTSAYVAGKPWWSVSVAVVEDGHPIVGVVYAPDTDELYEAVLGQGATLNGAPIAAKDRQVLEGCSMLSDARMLADPRWVMPWPPMRIEARNSVAYRMCLVASGAFDASIALSPKHDWDIAAADLIVTEAGGVATDHLGKSFIYNRDIARQTSLACAGPALPHCFWNA